ncbi:hypothetical protein QQS21_003317 [Conoideocrella luteorostrata]|uniref:Uncharacterized protein n=1 Tax=Conoideocrella luteorostrata TaxID=1105319 RepID=A0AAJ0CTG2_9HYPO|nr:hypothetical protein QQS21_003317 [Conoideocrella luteorostrata]
MSEDGRLMEQRQQQRQQNQMPQRAILPRLLPSSKKPASKPAVLKSPVRIRRGIIAGRVRKAATAAAAATTTTTTTTAVKRDRQSLPEVPGFMPLFPQVMPSRRSTTWKPPQPSTAQLIEALNSHRINTLTELVRIERIAAACTSPSEAQAFQSPMTAAWIHYVTSHQLTTELRNLTPNYPLTADVMREAYSRVRSDPAANRSWNLAWLCLMKVKDDGLIAVYATLEAMKPEMWGGKSPSPEDISQLAACFEAEWSAAVDRMLRHWSTPPTWC